MKKILSIILTIILVVSVVPTGVLSITANAESNTESYYTYTVYDGKAIITAVDESISGDVTIPSTLGGYLVTGIGYYAFYDCDSLESVTIGNSVTSIGDYAFHYCSSLESVTIGNSVTSIGVSAFFGCSRLENITVDNNTAYSSEDGVLFNKAKTELIHYPWGKTSSSYTIPSSVTSIGDSAFYECDSLESVTIGNSVTSIGDSAFCYCYGLESVTIGSSVTSIGDSAFYGCNSLENITVDNNNTAYASEAGILFNKAKTELIYYPGGKTSSSYTIPSSVTCIGDSAFSGCDSLEGVTIGNSVTSIGNYAFSTCAHLKSVTIGNSVTSIGNSAFSYCPSLKNVTIGNSVISIGYYAFYYCDSLTDVYYTGTESGKAAISIDGFNSELTNATWHYNYCENSDTKSHIYDSDCDSDCNVCGETRVVADHIYDNACDAECNVCGNARTAPHIYDNACDGTCNLCGYTRTPDVHRKKIFSDNLPNISTTNDATYPFDLNDGVYSSTNKAHSSSSTFAVKALSDCQLKIEYYTSTEANYDKLIIKHNSTTNVTKSGSTSWETISIDLTAGDVVEITYRKDGSDSSYNDTVYFKLKSSEVVDAETLEPTCEDSVVCDVCGVVVKAATGHSYSSNCDSECNRCGETRVAADHIYSYECDADCNACGETRVAADHIYDNACDADCNVCGQIRTTGVHRSKIFYDAPTNISITNSTTYPFALNNGIYSSTNKAHSSSSTFTVTALNDCTLQIEYYTSTQSSYDKLTIKHNSTTKVTQSGATSWATITIDLSAGDIVEISYSKNGSGSSNNDTIYFKLKSSESVTENTVITCKDLVVCDECGEVIKASTEHSYDNNCDGDCNVCVVTRVPSDHVYNDACDTTCNECGNARTAPHIYDSACDGTCNLCGYTRTPDVHKKKIFSDNLPNVSTTDSTTYPFALNDGIYSSTNKAHNSSSTFTITALYDCTLQIEYYTSTQTTYDKLTIKHNSTTKVTKSGSTSWATLSIDLSAGDIVEISYSKNGSTSSNNDTIYFKLKSSEVVDAETLEPTCEDAVVCVVCNAVVKPATGHSYTNSYDTICNTCGAGRSISSVTKTDGVFTYTIIPDGDGGKITITEVNTTASGQVTVPSALENVPVTSIGENAFKDCTRITEITIPEGVTTIGRYAFSNCTRLTKINIPDSVESMGNYILSGCTGLLEVKIPYLGGSFGYLFGGNNSTVPPSLKQVTVSRGTISSSAFSDCDSISIIILGDGVTAIGSNAFAGCNSITKVTIGNGTETIGVSAFKNCVSLTQVTLGTSVVMIDVSAFEYCVSLRKIIIPDSTVDINDSAFKDCYSLSTVVIGQSVDVIGDYAFENCESLEEIVIPNSTTLIGASAFQDCTSLTKAAIGNSVTTIYENAFAGCSKLEYAVLPNSTTYIGEYAFSDCTSLKRAVIKGRTDHINNGTFSGCSNLIAVAFPVNVTTLAYGAFSGCYKLSEVWYEGTKTDRDEIVIAYGNNYIESATWKYGEFDTINHKYDNVCDEICNICFEVREAHSYTNSCDTNCNICGKTRPLVHTYDGDCDAQCNVCGAKRTAGNHTYEDDCDTSCKYCTHQRKAPHNYDDNNDLICNDCGYERPPYTPGDIDGIEGVTDRDAVYLLYHTFLSDIYPVNQDCDFNNDGSVNDKDAIYLLYHTFLPDFYPIN